MATRHHEWTGHTTRASWYGEQDGRGQPTARRQLYSQVHRTAVVLVSIEASALWSTDGHRDRRPPQSTAPTTVEIPNRINQHLPTVTGPRQIKSLTSLTPTANLKSVANENECMMVKACRTHVREQHRSTSRTSRKHVTVPGGAGGGG